MNENIYLVLDFALYQLSKRKHRFDQANLFFHNLNEMQNL